MHDRKYTGTSAASHSMAFRRPQKPLARTRARNGRQPVGTALGAVWALLEGRRSRLT